MRQCTRKRLDRYLSHASAATVDVLEPALASAKQGKGRAVGIVANAGVGKSRLCFEFTERCRARGVPVYDAHCPAHGKTLPFLPMLELLRNYFGITDADSDDAAR